jgi:hypothetical protein
MKYFITTCIVNSGQDNIGTYTICAYIHYGDRCEIFTAEEGETERCQGQQDDDPLLDLGHSGYLRSLCILIKNNCIMHKLLSPLVLFVSTIPEKKGPISNLSSTE